MKKYKVEWYLDWAGCDGIRELGVEAENEEEANTIACDIIMNHWTIGEITEVKEA